MAEATTSDADMDDLQARSHFRLGRQLYDEGRFADAAREFEIAYGLSGRAQLLYNVYLGHRDAQHTEKAAAALRGYLSAIPEAPGREHLEARLGALEATLATERAEAERNRAAAAEAAQAQAQAEARARAAEAAAQPDASRPIWPWFVVGAGAAAIVGGGVLGALATSDGDTLRQSCVLDSSDGGVEAPLQPGDACASSIGLDDERSRIQGQALLGDVLWIGGAAVATTGLLLAFLLPDEEPDMTSPVVSAGCGPRACAAELQLRF